MAKNEMTNGTGPPSLGEVRTVLLHNSTKRRTDQLRQLQDRIANDDLTQDDWDFIIRAVFSTLPLYVDMNSRHAVEDTIKKVLKHGKVDDQAELLVRLVVQEAENKSLGSSSAFILVRWLHYIIPEVAATDQVWTAWGQKVMRALAVTTNIVFSSNPRTGPHDAVIRTTRRALKRVVTTPERGDVRLADTVKFLTAKQSTPAPFNGLVLGSLAEVCHTITTVRPLFETHKPAYDEFYTREILGSRTVLPKYLADSYANYFRYHVSAADLEKTYLPALDKALLRSPEIVLVDVLSSMLEALPRELTPMLSDKLTPALLKSTTSSNAAVKKGAPGVLQLICRQNEDQASVNKLLDQILAPLSSGKITSVDTRSLYAGLLRDVHASAESSSRIVSGLTPVITKEANEAAATIEINSFTHHLSQTLAHQGSIDEKAVSGLITKGLSDKKPQIKAFWTEHLLDIVWESPDSTKDDSAFATILSDAAAKLLEIWNEAQSSPIQAIQSRLIVAAYAVTALASRDELPSTAAAQLAKAGIVSKCLVVAPKPSIVFNTRIFSKLTLEEDLRWFSRALFGITSQVLSADKETGVAWAQGVVYLITTSSLPHKIKTEALRQLQSVYQQQIVAVSEAIRDGVCQWAYDVEHQTKDSLAVLSASGSSKLHQVINDLVPAKGSTGSVSAEDLEKQALAMLVVARKEISPKASWIKLCLDIGVDPGTFVRTHPGQCLDIIRSWTEDPRYGAVETFQKAAYAAAADLAFVAPDVILPLLVDQISKDLDPLLLADIGPTEAAIYRTPEGTAFVDVLSSQKAAPPPSKNSKDYDTLKWEAELRAQLASKKGAAKKLTKEEQARVDAQLKQESETRAHVTAVVAKIRRGAGLIQGLVTGPPTDSTAWFGKCTQRLFDAITGGAGSLIGESITEAYMQCSSLTSVRLGAMRPFIGAVALRAAGVAALPQYIQEEPLGDAVTRILYRLRFMSEQRPFDPVTLAYALHLVFIVLENGAVEKSGDEADEQLVLAGEFVSFHTDICSDARLPRARILSTIIRALQGYTPHFRLFKDCLNDMSRGIATNASGEEMQVILKAVIVPEGAVRTASLQAISAELELSSKAFSTEIWLAIHDDLEENRALADEIWEENELVTAAEDLDKVLPYAASKDGQLRRATARAVAALIKAHSSEMSRVLATSEEQYVDLAKPRAVPKDKYGMPLKVDIDDPWPARHGLALVFKELAPSFDASNLVSFFTFMAEKGPLGDSQTQVREAMLDAATSIVAQRGNLKVEDLMSLFERILDGPDAASKNSDLVNEAVVILYGALARHLKFGDKRVPKVVQRLLTTLSTPSESVQYAVAQCLPPLVQASSSEVSSYVQKMMDELLNAKKYAVRRGAAYGLAGIVAGRGIASLREFRILIALHTATENKKDPNQRQGAFLAYELLSLILGRVFEPYVIQIVPQLLVGFADTSLDVRESCLDAAKTCFSTLSSFGVKQVLPMLLGGLDESQWRSKKGACDSLGAMAYLDPQQLAVSLPQIIPPLTEVLNDSHKEVRGSANRSLQRFGEVISNPEIKSQVDILLKALSDPTKYTDDALDALIKVNFIHYLDAPSLALVVRVLERGLSDKSSTKRKSSQIIGSLAHLTERKDLMSHLPILVAGLRLAVVDPVPATRATASKALGSTVEKLGEDALPELIPSLMNALKTDTGAGDRLGSAQALSEVLAGLGTGRLEETLPTILQNVSSSRAAIREGFMSLFIFLPATFGNSFANYLGKIIPPILAGLADEVESIRETALRAGRLLVKNFATRAIDLLLPELERGLADDSYRIRLSSVELVGDLLFNLTGISGKTEQDETEDTGNEAGQSLLEVLGVEKRDKVLSALYICRCDTSGLVRAAAINVWKALVSTPRTLREMIPTLTQLLIRRLASSNMEQKVIAGNALGELIRKAGENVLATLLPTLEEGLQTSSDSDAREGICIALRELISSAAPEGLEDYEKTLISVVRTALVDSDSDVREAAAEAFDSLQKIFGKRAVDQVLPYLLNLLRSEDDADNALSALLTLLTEQTRANIILPNLLPTLLAPPISAFNARALASLAEVAGSSMTRRLPNMINALMDAIVACKDPELKQELDSSFDTILLSVDEFDGLNSLMSVMLGLVKHADHRKRAAADLHLAEFFKSATVDISRYYPDLIRVLLLAFDDSDSDVVKAAWTALSALTGRLRKEEMESLVQSTRQALNHVGVAGHDLPGFSLPKGINAILPIFLQGLMNGTAEQRTQAALAISDIVDRTSADGLKPFVTQITGPLIRVVSERSVEVKSAILLTLNNLLEKIPTFLKPFLPQLQRTFAKSLADTSSELLRTRAAKALGTLITLAPRIDPLISELVTGSKTPDAGVRGAMLKALYEVVSKAGANMNEASRNAILGLIDAEQDENDTASMIVNAKLLGALIRVLPSETSTGLIKNRILPSHITYASALALNSILVESPETLTSSFNEQMPSYISTGIKHSNPEISTSFVLAAGKYLLTPTSTKTPPHIQPLLTTLTTLLPPAAAAPTDTRRLSLVVLRTIARHSLDTLIRPSLHLLAPPVFSCVRDPLIPIKLAAEQAFLALFDVVERDAEVFDAYINGKHGDELGAGPKRSMGDYFRRVTLRLGAQGRERAEAEGRAKGAQEKRDGLGLGADEEEDEREVWSVGKVEFGDAWVE